MAKLTLISYCKDIDNFEIVPPIPIEVILNLKFGNGELINYNPNYKDFLGSLSIIYSEPIDNNIIYFETNDGVSGSWRTIKTISTFNTNGEYTNNYFFQNEEPDVVKDTNFRLKLVNSEGTFYSNLVLSVYEEEEEVTECLVNFNNNFNCLNNNVAFSFDKMKQLIPSLLRTDKIRLQITENTFNTITVGSEVLYSNDSGLISIGDIECFADVHHDDFNDIRDCNGNAYGTYEIFSKNDVKKACGNFTFTGSGNSGNQGGGPSEGENCSYSGNLSTNFDGIASSSSIETSNNVVDAHLILDPLDIENATVTSVFKEGFKILFNDLEDTQSTIEHLQSNTLRITLNSGYGTYKVVQSSFGVDIGDCNAFATHCKSCVVRHNNSEFIIKYGEPVIPENSLIFKANDFIEYPKNVRAEFEIPGDLNIDYVNVYNIDSEWNVFVNGMQNSNPTIKLSPGERIEFVSKEKVISQADLEENKYDSHFYTLYNSFYIEPQEYVNNPFLAVRKNTIGLYRKEPKFNVSTSHFSKERHFLYCFQKLTKLKREVAFFKTEKNGIQSNSESVFIIESDRIEFLEPDLTPVSLPNLNEEKVIFDGINENYPGLRGFVFYSLPNPTYFKIKGYNSRNRVVEIIPDEYQILNEPGEKLKLVIERIAPGGPTTANIYAIAGFKNGYTVSIEKQIVTG